MVTTGVLPSDSMGPYPDGSGVPNGGAVIDGVLPCTIALRALAGDEGPLETRVMAKVVPVTSNRARPMRAPTRSRLTDFGAGPPFPSHASEAGQRDRF